MRLPIDFKRERFRRPFHGVHVEIRERRSQNRSANIHRATKRRGRMDGAGHIIRVDAPVLHDVDLATCRPGGIAVGGLPVGAGLGDVLAEHPDRRPSPGTRW